ncbi:hypothetical protein MBLNU457_g0696t1 [Dothideomycetes sp. NU457]
MAVCSSHPSQIQTTTVSVDKTFRVESANTRDKKDSTKRLDRVVGKQELNGSADPVGGPESESKRVESGAALSSLGERHADLMGLSCSWSLLSLRADEHTGPAIPPDQSNQHPTGARNAPDDLTGSAVQAKDHGN